MTATLAYPAIHPFPARMAPEIIEGVLEGLDEGVLLLDPMMGSGSFPLAAGRKGHRAIGVDSDPLAVKIARTGLCNWDGDKVRLAGRRIAKEALLVSAKWSHQDDESDRFIDFWFDAAAKTSLGALADRIALEPATLQDPLWIAFSRLIITKDAGASRARDVSHSRPHRVRDKSSFVPAERFVHSVDLVVKRAMMYGPPMSGVTVTSLRADARRLPLADGSIDAIMTSPPYLTAIDYLRGHRMSLVWMGYSISELRRLRSDNIGSERGADLHEDLPGVGVELELSRFRPRSQAIINRYLGDLHTLLSEVGRVLRADGTATFVVADATSAGQTLNIARAVRLVGEVSGLIHDFDEVRELPDNRRYLPTPDITSPNALAKRMRTETIVTMRHA